MAYWSCVAFSDWPSTGLMHEVNTRIVSKPAKHACIISLHDTTFKMLSFAAATGLVLAEHAVFLRLLHSAALWLSRSVSNQLVVDGLMPLNSIISCQSSSPYLVLPYVRRTPNAIERLTKLVGVSRAVLLADPPWILHIFDLFLTSIGWQTWIILRSWILEVFRPMCLSRDLYFWIFWNRFLQQVPLSIFLLRPSQHDSKYEFPT